VRTRVIAANAAAAAFEAAWSSYDDE